MVERSRKFIWVWLIIGLLFGCSDSITPNNNQPIPDTGVDMTDMGPDVGPDDMDTEDQTPIPDMIVVPNPDMPDEPDDEIIEPIVLRVDAVVPPRGSVDGGTQIAIRGTGFSNQTVAYLGSRRADVRLVDGSLVGTSPSSAGPGAVNVKVLDPEMGEFTLVGGFTYVTTMSIDAVAPDRIPTSGDIEVTITGRGFNAQTRVSFCGNTGMRHELVDATTLRVLTPPGTAGTCDVRATSPDATSVLRDAITYFDTLEIDSVRPATGPTAGGNTATIHGRGFVDGMSFSFGPNAATVTSVDPGGEEAQVIVPAGVAGLVAVSAVTPEDDAAITANAYYYAAPGEVLGLAAIDPAIGPIAGGNPVHLIGTGLDAADLEIRFAGALATITESGEGHAIVQAPAGSIGTVDVTAASAGNNATLPQSYEYVENLWVDRVTPSSGDVDGGYDVVIEGEGFTGADRVYFGSVAAAFTIDSDEQITATAPSHSAGTVDIAVERGIRATFVNGFTFTEDLEIWGFTPARGAIAGGTYVEVRGRGFVGTMGVDFGDIPGVDVRHLDAQTLSVRTPPAPAGAVDVTVRRGQDSATHQTRYTYFNPGSMFGGAWGGPVQGAVNVTVFSMNGGPIEGAFVMLSTNPASPYQGYTNANGQVTLSGPEVYGEQTVTAIAAGHSSATVQRVNAENITVFLNPAPEDGEPPPPGPGASFQGFVSGLDKLAEPGPSEFQMAIVYTTQRDPFTQNPDPGEGNVVLGGNGTYTLRSRVGDVALVAVGGIFNSNTRVFTPLIMGVERYLFAGDGESYTVDIDLDIWLDQQLAFKIPNSPIATSQANTHQVVPYLDFGFEGVFGGVDIARGTSDVIYAHHQAPLTGILADVSYFAVGGAYTGADAGPPLAVALKRGITNINGLIEIRTLGIPEVTSPLIGLPPVDRLFEFSYNHPRNPAFFYVMIETFDQVPVWDVFLPGDARSFRLPDFPSFAHLPPEDRPAPYPSGLMVLIIIAPDIPNFDFENFSYSDMGVNTWHGYALGFEFISL